MKRTLALVLLLLSIAVIGQAGSITLAWNPSVGAIGYEVHYGLASGNYTEAVDIGPATSAALSGLTDGMTYYFAALAYDSANNDSAYSNEVSQLIAPPPSGDTILPTAQITSTANPVKGKWTTVTASASDNVGVTQVTIYVNGQPLCTDTTAPYSCQWKVPGARGVRYQLQAEAIDLSGNHGFSSVVEVVSQ